MSKTAVIYWSQTGNTEAMANAIAEGAGVSAVSVSDISAAEAAEYDTLVLGCPAMGAEELDDSEFDPFYQELKASLSGKNVAIFGSYDWGDGEWLRKWEADVKETGANFVEALQINLTPDDDGIAACKALGAKVAAL
ncbi:MAG: flavodoxin [Firmicutes bacterium]|nr:flavodoxin [Bacillota bacterium]